MAGRETQGLYRLGKIENCYLRSFDLHSQLGFCYCKRLQICLKSISNIPTSKEESCTMKLTLPVLCFRHRLLSPWGLHMCNSLRIHVRGFFSKRIYQTQVPSTPHFLYIIKASLIFSKCNALASSPIFPSSLSPIPHYSNLRNPYHSSNGQQPA